MAHWDGRHFHKLIYSCYFKSIWQRKKPFTKKLRTKDKVEEEHLTEII